MKSPLFYHVTSSDRPLSKWATCGLFGLLAGFTVLPALAAAPLSNVNSQPASSGEKGKTAKNRSAHARQSLTAQNANRKETAVSDWQKRQPFAETGLTGSGEKAVHGKAASLHVPAQTRNRLPLKIPVADLPAIAQPDTPIQRSSSVFKRKTAVDTVEPYKAASFTTENSEPALSYDGMNAGNRGYSVGPARFTINYEKANDRSREKMAQFLAGKAVPDIADNDFVESRSDRDNWHLGMEYAAGNGRVNAAVNYVHMKDMKNANAGNDNSPDSADLKTFTIGYTYDVSEKTSFYGMVARTEYEKEAMAGYMRGNGFDEDSVTGFQLGVTHKF